ncbi:MAG: hypothetical protein ACYC4D_09075 [Thermoleophilia bacterium]
MTSQQNHISNYDRLGRFITGPGLEFIPNGYGAPLIQQGITNYEHEISDHNVSDNTKLFIESSLNLGSAAGSKYAQGISLSFSTMNFINYATNDPDDWTCMNCHQYFRDEVQESFGLSEAFSLR